MRNNDNKLVFLDFDGTISDSAELPRVHPQVQEALARAELRGWRWVINSDRDLADLLRITSELPIKLRPAAVVGFLRKIKLADGKGGYRPYTKWNYKCTTAHRELGLRLAPHISAWRKEVCATFRVRLDLCTLDGLAFVVYPEDVLELKDKLNIWLNDFQEAEVCSNHESCFIIHNEYSKGKATREVAHLLGTQRLQVAAIGDSLNDLTMLNQNTSGIAGCPASACMEVRNHICCRPNGFIAHSSGALGTAEILNLWLSTPSIIEESDLWISEKGSHYE